MKRKLAQTAATPAPQRTTRSVSKQRTVAECFQFVKAKLAPVASATIAIERVASARMERFAQDIILDNYVKRRLDDEQEELEFVQWLRSFTLATDSQKQLDRASYGRLIQLIAAERGSINVRVNAFTLLTEAEKRWPHTEFALQGPKQGILKVADELAWDPVCQGQLLSTAEDTGDDSDCGGSAPVGLFLFVELVANGNGRAPPGAQGHGGRPSRRVTATRSVRRRAVPKDRERESEVSPTAGTTRGDSGHLLLLLHLASIITADFYHRLEACKASRDFKHVEESFWGRLHKGMSPVQRGCLSDNLMKIIAESAPDSIEEGPSAASSDSTEKLRSAGEQLFAWPRDTCCAAQSLLAVAMEFHTRMDEAHTTSGPSQTSANLLKHQVSMWNGSTWSSMKARLHFIKTMESPKQKLEFITAVLNKCIPKIACSSFPGLAALLESYKGHLLQAYRTFGPLLAAGLITEATKAHILVQLSSGVTPEHKGVRGIVHDVCHEFRRLEKKSNLEAFDESTESALLAAEELGEAIHQCSGS